MLENWGTFIEKIWRIPCNLQLSDMTNFIPIFPLSVVIYPGEKVHLHVFEPRYKQLINECHENNKPFGVPAVVNNRLQEMGTLVQVTDIVQKYENGEMDIKTQGLQVFRILEVIKSVPDKLYSGAIVNYPDNDDDAGNRDLMQKVINGVKELHRLLNVSKDFKKPETELKSYDVAHHAGLSLEEEYEVLGLLKELQREEYIKRHLQKVLPMLMEMETLKEKVKLNGHFRNLSAFDLDLDV
jgi:Lon protease-like protein